MVLKNSLTSSVTSVTRQSEVITSFRGPLIQYPIVKSINRNKSTLRRWIVLSQGKRSTLVRYLFGKLLWDELNSFETTIFWHLREITTDITIYLSLKALVLGVDRKILRERLKNGKFLGLEFISRQQYLSIKGRVNFIFREEEITLRKVTKYSGYTKHYKDKGSLAPERELISEVLEPVCNIDEEVILKYLTVGEIPLFGGDAFILTRPNKVETVSSRNQKKMT